MRKNPYMYASNRIGLLKDGNTKWGWTQSHNVKKFSLNTLNGTENVITHRRRDAAVFRNLRESGACLPVLSWRYQLCQSHAGIENRSHNQIDKFLNVRTQNDNNHKDDKCLIKNGLYQYTGLFDIKSRNKFQNRHSQPQSHSDNDQINHCVG